MVCVAAPAATLAVAVAVSHELVDAVGRPALAVLVEAAKATAAFLAGMTGTVVAGAGSGVIVLVAMRTLMTD